MTPTPQARCTCLGILLFLCCVAPSVCAQAIVGAFGGVDLTDLSGDAPSSAKYTSEVGFAVGAVSELRIATDVWLSVQPTWIQRGSRIAFAVQGQEELNDSLVLKANYVSVPILVKIVSNNGKSYVTGGADLGFLLNSTISGLGDPVDVSHTFRQTDLSGNFAFGIMLPVGTPRVSLEARYSQSILNAAHPDQKPEVYSLPPRFRWSGLQLFVGFLYPLGGGG
jgi:uncharacterized protein YwlG (UPF0340 family)